MIKTPYAVIQDLGKIVPKEYFLEFQIRDKNFKFNWTELQMYKLLKFVRDLDSAYIEKGVKYQVSVELQIFAFLHGVNSEFKMEHFKKLTADSLNSILDVILEPIFKRDEQKEQGTAKQGQAPKEPPKKKALRTLV